MQQKVPNFMGQNQRRKFSRVERIENSIRTKIAQIAEVVGEWKRADHGERPIGTRAAESGEPICQTTAHRGVRRETKRFSARHQLVCNDDVEGDAAIPENAPEGDLVVVCGVDHAVAIFGAVAAPPAKIVQPNLCDCSISNP